MESFKGVIFDCDGVLIDTMHMWDTIEIQYLTSLGATPNDDMNMLLRSYSSVEVVEHFQEEYGIKKTTEMMLAERYKLIEDYYFNKAMLKDESILSVLELLHQRGVKMCVATATCRTLVEAALERCGILKYFGRIFTCDEEDTSKSSPDIFLRAAEFLDTDIGETLVVEDSLHAIKTAKSAGFIVVGVYDLSADDQQDEIKEICDYYWEHMGGMLEIL